MSILLLKQDEIKPLISMKETLEAVEKIFKEKELGRVQMPPKVYLQYKEFNGDLRIMPSYIEGNISAVKIVNVHPNNKKFDLPTIMAIIVLVSPRTGKVIAIMDGTLITALRTAAAGGIAMKHLSREGSETLGLIGAGVQAVAQITAAISVMDLKKVSIFDIDEHKRDRLICIMREKNPSIRFFPTNNIKDAIIDKDIIITVTPSTKPIVKNEWIKNGIHINAIGADAPGKQELDPLILKRAKIIVDDIQQASHSGEINVPLKNHILSKKDIYAELGEITLGKKNGRISDKEITIFDSTGLAIQDAIIAEMVYKKAIEKGVGSKIDLL